MKVTVIGIGSVLAQMDMLPKPSSTGLDVMLTLTGVTGFTVMVADAPVKPLVRTQPFASVAEVRVYDVVLPGLGLALKGVPLTTAE